MSDARTSERDYRPILGAGLNQVQGLRDALCWSIAGNALLDLTPDAVCDWLRSQGLEPPIATSDVSTVSQVYSSVDKYRWEGLADIAVPAAALSSSLVNPISKEVGSGRSGAGWSQGAAFCISSAFVRVLGASEQFELDVLKALLYYRPAGKPLGSKDEHIAISVEVEVLDEQPRQEKDVDYYEKPALWTWIRGAAAGNDERRKIFQRVFGMELTSGNTEQEKKENSKRRKEWYEKRNMIAHGRSGVAISLREYLDVDIFVTRSMFHLARECHERLLLEI